MRCRGGERAALEKLKRVAARAESQPEKDCQMIATIAGATGFEPATSGVTGRRS